MATFGRGTSKFGTQNGWEFQGQSNPTTPKRETAHDELNNEIASELYDERIEINENFKAAVKATVPTIPAVIGMLNLLTCTQIQINTTNKDFAGLNLVGHEHTDGTDNGDVFSIAHGMTLDRGFGASTFGFTGVTEVTESSCTIKCEHAEVPGDGDTAAGQNHNPGIEISITAYDGAATPPSGFEVTDTRLGTDAEGYQTTTTVAYKALAFAEAA